MRVLPVDPPSDPQDPLRTQIAQLERHVADLTARLAARDLASQALEATTCGVTIAEATAPTFPLIYCNAAFEQITGYAAASILGESCRFLQGPETDPATVGQIRAALYGGRSCRVLIRNYRRDRSPFWNDLTLAPIHDEQGRVTHFVGVQQDVSAARAAEEAVHRLQAEVIAAQQAALAELSTPLIPIAPGVVIMPLVGSLDTHRAGQLVHTLLAGVEQQRARVVIIDITGVTVVDSHVARTLLQAAQALRLLGARVILTGTRPEVAQTLVGLGIDLHGLITYGTLQQGIASVIRSS